MVHSVELEIAGRTLKLETGHMAKQADGSVLASYGDTMVLATAVASKTLKPDTDFLPLTVNYQEKAYSACLLYTSPSPRDQRGSRMPSSA